MRGGQGYMPVMHQAQPSWPPSMPPSMHTFLAPQSSMLLSIRSMISSIVPGASSLHSVKNGRTTYCKGQGMR